MIAPAFAPEALRGAGGEEEPAPARLPTIAHRRAPGALELRSVGGRLPGADARPRHRRGGRRRRSPRSAPPTAARAARSRLRLAGLQARQVERHRVRRRRARTVGIGAGQMSRVDSVRIAVSRRARRWPGSVRRVRRVLPVPRRRRRGGQGGRRRRHPAGRLGARRRGRSPPPTSTAWRWCSPASATSGTSDARACVSWSSDRAGASTRSPGSSRQSPLCERLVVAPGNPGIAGEAEGHLHPGRRRRDRRAGRRRGGRARRPGRLRARGRRSSPASATRCARPGCRSSARRARPPRSRARRRSPSG